MGQTLFVTILLAGMIYGSPLAASISKKYVASSGSSSAHVTTELPATTVTIENIPSEIVETAAVDYCYAGSVVDPATGEAVDLFVLCAEDGLEQNIDLA